MRFFRVYELDRAGSIKDTHFIQANSEAAALEAAKQRLPMRDLEVWDQWRFVGRVSLGDSLPVEVAAALLGNAGDRHIA